MDDDKKVFYPEAVKAIKSAILKSRYLAARLANAEQLKLYFSVGGFVSANTRHGKWGTGAIEAISRSLQAELPGLRGFSEGNIKKMRIFFEEWSSVVNRSTVSNEFESPANRQTLSGEIPAGANRQSAIDDLAECFSLAANRSTVSNDLEKQAWNAFLSVGFSQHVEILFNCKTEEERWYYIRQSAANFWSVRVLRRHLAAGDFRHAGTLPNNFALTMPDARQVSRAVQSFKDEYLLDFINIEDAADNEDVDERVLESAIVNSIKQFIQSLGPDFCFVGNQYRLIVGEEEFFIDLLFYHRLLRSMVAIELKRGKFKPAYLGQLNFYLSALDKQVKHPNESQSIGLLLCQEANRTIVELAVQDFNKPIGVATYRLGSEIPEQYKPLIPMIDGVQRILTESSHE